MRRSWIRLGLCCLLFGVATARSQAQGVPPARLPAAETSPGITPLPPLDEEVQDLKAQVNELSLELSEMKANIAAAAAGKGAPAPKKSPEDEQAAFNKLYDKARGRLPNVAINGVFQSDVGFFNQDAVNRATVGNAVDGWDFRRARLSAKGSVTETVNYFFQMDFAFFGRPTFTDVWLEQTDIPIVGNVRIGQWKQPFSLEVVSSFRYTTFMERSLLFQTFDPFRHPGIGFYNHSEDLNWTWAASGFRSGQDQFGDSATNALGWATSERITYLPWWDEDSNGRGYLHLGMGHFFATPPDGLVNFRTIPELYIGQQNPIPNGNQQPVPGNVSGTPFFLQTGTLLVNQYNVIGAEALLVHGPFSWQTEPMINFVDQRNGPTVALPGFYSQVGYFLTGEHRPYDRKAGAIDRVIPFENFFLVSTENGHCCGMGAWEVAFRVSYLDFTPVNRITADVVPVGLGGTLTDLTAGVNWYWNPYTKVVANWVHSYLDNPLTGRSEADGFAARAQIDF